MHVCSNYMYFFLKKVNKVVGKQSVKFVVLFLKNLLHSAYNFTLEENVMYPTYCC